MAALYYPTIQNPPSAHRYAGHRPPTPQHATDLLPPAQSSTRDLQLKTGAARWALVRTCADSLLLISPRVKSVHLRSETRRVCMTRSRYWSSALKTRQTAKALTSKRLNNSGNLRIGCRYPLRSRRQSAALTRSRSYSGRTRRQEVTYRRHSPTYSLWLCSMKNDEANILGYAAGEAPCMSILPER